MTQEQIEGNELIAEFMNEKIKVSKANGFQYVKGAMYPQELSYHSSWNWLMPVVEKVCSTVIKGNPPFNTDEFVRVEIVPNGYVKISNLRDTPILKNVSVECSLIKATWLAVVEFIKWYNQNK